MYLHVFYIQILKKIQGDGKGTMHYVTSVLNEWGQFLTTVVVASESEECYKRLAQGLTARFKRANAAAPKVLYADNNCCRYVKYLVLICTYLSTLPPYQLSTI